jgi:hypothetical protein
VVITAQRVLNRRKLEAPQGISRNRKLAEIRQRPPGGQLRVDLRH